MDMTKMKVKAWLRAQDLNWHRTYLDKDNIHTHQAMEHRWGRDRAAVFLNIQKNIFFLNIQKNTNSSRSRCGERVHHGRQENLWDVRRSRQRLGTLRQREVGDLSRRINKMRI